MKILELFEVSYEINSFVNTKHIKNYKLTVDFYTFIKNLNTVRYLTSQNIHNVFK